MDPRMSIGVKFIYLNMLNKNNKNLYIWARGLKYSQIVLGEILEGNGVWTPE